MSSRGRISYIIWGVQWKMIMWGPCLKIMKNFKVVAAERTKPGAGALDTALWSLPCPSQFRDRSSKTCTGLTEISQHSQGYLDSPKLQVWSSDYRTHILSKHHFPHKFLPISPNIRTPFGTMMLFRKKKDGYFTWVCVLWGKRVSSPTFKTDLNSTWGFHLLL